MNAYSELPLQYSQDVWTLMFARLTEHMTVCLGQNSEDSVRRAVRRMGEERGRFFFENARQKNQKADLMALYSQNCSYCTMDPRSRTRVLCQQPDQYLYEVDTCPLAGYWGFLGRESEGNWFCEEYQHAQLRGYTEGAGQVNLATRLTYKNRRENVGFMDDNVCRFSVYYRPSNATERLHDDSFVNGDSTEQIELSTEERMKDLNWKCIQTCHYILGAIVEDYGEDGKCAFGVALRKLAEELAAVMRKHADDLLQVCDGAFMSSHFPLALDSGSDPIWEQYKDSEARVLVQDNLLNSLKKSLNIQ